MLLWHMHLLFQINLFRCVTISILRKYVLIKLKKYILYISIENTLKRIIMMCFTVTCAQAESLRIQTCIGIFV